MTKTTMGALLLLVGGTVAACSPFERPAARTDLGAELFQSYCVQCHGTSGQGDGPMAEHLDQPPADLTALALANDGRMPRDHVMQTVYGYPGKFQSTPMPEFGPLLTGPSRKLRTEDGALIDTPVALIALVDYLETLQR